MGFTTSDAALKATQENVEDLIETAKDNLAKLEDIHESLGQNKPLDEMQLTWLKAYGSNIGISKDKEAPKAFSKSENKGREE